MQQISNIINNLPIGLKNKVEAIENLDIITPNRLVEITKDAQMRHW